MHAHSFMSPNPRRQHSQVLKFGSFGVSYKHPSITSMTSASHSVNLDDMRRRLSGPFLSNAHRRHIGETVVSHKLLYLVPASQQKTPVVRVTGMPSDDSTEMSK